jgi:hypothetical protein
MSVILSVTICIVNISVFIILGVVMSSVIVLNVMAPSKILFAKD